jgi:hypothetical protein
MALLRLRLEAQSSYLHPQGRLLVEGVLSGKVTFVGSRGLLVAGWPAQVPVGAEQHLQSILKVEHWTGIFQAC